MDILIGADPEVFVFNPNHGKPVSAHGLIEGTKWDPKESPTGMGATQVDGMALEFNIRPEKDIVGFNRNCKAMLRELDELIVGTGYKLMIAPSVVFDDGYIQSQPPEAQTLGCDPDFCGWTGATNPRPDGSLNMRTAAGHVHIGWTEDQDVYDTAHFDLCCALARHLDYTLGIYSLLWDSDSRRRLMYGRAGAFRPKPYGIEYRTLSNAWLKDVRLTYFVFKGAQEGTESFFNGSYRPESLFGDKAQKIIDENILDWRNTYPELDYPEAKINPLISFMNRREKEVA